MTTEIKETTKEYLKLFHNCTIGVGDTVRIVRDWKNGDYGYYDEYYRKNYGEICKSNYTVKHKRYDYYCLESETNWLSAPFFALELVNSEPDESDTLADYLAFHNVSGLAVGDKVKVVRKANDNEMGWDNDWVEDMDGCVGKVLTIIEDRGILGWRLDGGRCFPTFVLQKVDPSPVTEEIVIKEGSAIVNGKVLTKEDIGKLYYRVVRGGKRVKKNKKTVVDNRVPLVPVHNPDNLMPEQYGAVEGYRLLYADEIIERKQRYKEIEAWDDDAWIAMRFKGSSSNYTYRTKLSRKELAKLK